MAALSDALADIQAKILILDIERLPGLAPVWQQKTRYININQWQSLPSLLCFAAKWYGSRTEQFYSVWDDGAEGMAKESWRLYNEADIVIGYFSTGFDNKHLRSVWRDAKMPPPRPWKDVDLFRVNASLFGDESKSLAHLCQRLGVPGKLGHYDIAQAFACVEGDEKARKLMRRYNVGDIRATEHAYRELLPWISNHPHVIADRSQLRCNRCACAELTREPVDYTAEVLRYPLYRCNRCGGVLRDRSHNGRIGSTKGVR